MILDNNLMFDPFFTAITVSRVSTNIIDLNIGRDLEPGTGLDLLIISNLLFAGGTSINIQFQGAQETALGSGVPGTYNTFAETGALTTAVLNAGNAQNIDVFSIDVPGRTTAGGSLTFPRFLQINYVVVGTYTAGAMGASITLDDARDALPAYNPGVIVNN